ncbi:MAG: lipopolysaccharide biosynthesis protein [Emcibacter sp.]|nr:lipopolysaccharide biosynthesis protein [Emcibacter sp.]
MSETAKNNDDIDLSSTMIRGSIWMLSMNWLVRILGIISTSILARLLVPEDFGLMAMVMVIEGITCAFLDFGVIFALIQKKNAERRHYDSGWTIRIIQSFTIAFILASSAPLISSFYGEERLNILVIIIALSIAVGGFENIGTVLFRKNMDYKKDFIFNITKKMLSVIFVLSLAVYFRNYYAFAVGILLNSIALVILSFILSPYRPKLTMKGAKDIWSFSQWNMLKGIAQYLYMQGDKLIVGKVSSAQDLGFYVVGKEISSLASTEIISPLGRALVPGFSVIQHDIERVRSGFLKSFSAMLLIALPVGVGIFAISADAIPILLGDGWDDAIPLLQALCLFAVTRVLSDFAGNIIIVVGKIKISSFLSWLELIIFFSLVYPAFLWNGIIGIAFARVLTGCFSVLFNLSVLSHLIKTTVLNYFMAMYRPVLAVAFMMVGIEMTHIALLQGTPYEVSIFSLLLKIIVGGLVYVISALTLWAVTGKVEGIEKIIIHAVISKIKRPS